MQKYHCTDRVGYSCTAFTAHVIHFLSCRTSEPKHGIKDDGTYFYLDADDSAILTYPVYFTHSLFVYRVIEKSRKIIKWAELV